MVAEARFCHCGTCAEAIAVARKLYADAAGADCPIWALQIATAMRSIAIDHLVATSTAGLDRAILAEVCNALVVLTHETTPVTEIIAEVLVRQKEIHG